MTDNVTPKYYLVFHSEHLTKLCTRYREDIYLHTEILIRGHAIFKPHTANEFTYTHCQAAGATLLYLSRNTTVLISSWLDSTHLQWNRNYLHHYCHLLLVVIFQDLHHVLWVSSQTSFCVSSEGYTCCQIINHKSRTKHFIIENNLYFIRNSTKVNKFKLDVYIT